MLSIDSKVYCSAGINYIVICPNGDVYRCMADYGGNRPALFNVKDGWRRLEKPLLCSHSKCEASCDTKYTRKAIFKPERSEPEIVGSEQDPPEESFEDPAPYLISPDQPVDELFRHRIHIVWLPTFRCNYTCQYCEYAAGRHTLHEIRSASPELSVTQWFEVWRAIREMYDGIGVSISGGEPLLSKATLPIMNLLGDAGSCDITTNLSVNPMGLMRHMEKPSLITASLHPTASHFNKELFFGTLLCLKRNGYNVSVNFVGYPLQLFMADDYKEWFDTHQIPFNIDQWCGGDHNGFYSKLSDTEQHFLNEISICRSTQFRRFNHEITTESEEVVIQQGSPFTINGRVKNDGTVSWYNEKSGEKSSFKLGLKIMRFGSEKEILLESRQSLPSKTISPGETFDFEMHLPDCLLTPEIYLMKIDLLRDGPEGFWFEHRGADDKKLKLSVLKGPTRYIMVLDTMDVDIYEGELLRLKGRVKNTEDLPWLCKDLAEEEAYKIGVRVARDEHPEEAVFEFRALTIREDIFPGEWFDFEITKNATGLEQGVYHLKIDLLREGFWWFEQRGAQPVKMKVNILGGTSKAKNMVRKLLKHVRGK